MNIVIFAHNLGSWLIILFRRLSAWRYKGLAVGLDNISPWHSAPNWLQYTLCGRYPDSKPELPTNLSFPCTDVGTANRYRYVILQGGRPNPAAVCFTEVQVFANGKQNTVTQWQINSNQFLSR